MRRYRAKTIEVLAVQVGPDGTVELDGRVHLGDAGTWVVQDLETGVRSCWTDEAFRARFEPVDGGA